MNYKEAYFFTARLLAVEEAEQAVRLISRNEVDWNKIVRIASSHLALPAIFIRLNNQECRDFLPAELICYLEYFYDLNRQRNLQILRQVEKINHLLRSQNISPVVLKGVACLLDDVYKDPGERMVGDIDLLVGEEQLLPAVHTLKSAGYIQDSPIRKGLIKHIKHYPKLINPDEMAAVEVHRQPVCLAYTDFLDNRAIIKNCKTARSKTDALVPADEQMVIHNFIHSQLSDKAHYYGFILIRNSYEFHLLRKRLKNQEVAVPFRYRVRYRAYSEITSELMGLNPRLSLRTALTMKRLKFHLSNKRFYRANLLLLYLIRKICSYFMKIPLLFYTRDFRLSLREKLTDRKWYGKHFTSIRDDVFYIVNRRN